MKKTIITILAFIIFFSTQSFAQKYTKGYIKFEITDVKADNPDDPQMAMMENMLKGTITKLYFNQERALTKVNSMGGMSVIKIIVDKNGNSEMYMDMMGQKFLMKINKDEAEKIADENVEKKPEFKHFKDKTKDILGFKTHLVEAIMEGNEVGSMQFWITDEIDTKGVVQQGMDNDAIGGFPLEYTITMPGQFSMTTKATKFKKDFDDAVFDFDKSGFQEKSLDELKNMGMGGVK